MHGGPEAFQGLVLGAPDGLLGDLKQLGHHINGLFVLIQEVQNEPLSIGEYPQWDGGILQTTGFQGCLWGLEGPIIQLCGSGDGSPKLPSPIDGGGTRDQSQPGAHRSAVGIERAKKPSVVFQQAYEHVLGCIFNVLFGLATKHPPNARPHQTAVRRNEIRKRPAVTSGAGIQINLVAVGIRHVPYRTTGPSKPSPRS